MTELDTSVSSRSFREKILIASIRSILDRNPSKPITISADNSDQTSAMDQRTSSVESGASGNHASHEPKPGVLPSMSSNIPLVDSEKGPGATPNRETADGPRLDPLASNLANGVEYKSMVWW